jgi:hypothetical protein
MQTNVLILTTLLSAASIGSAFMVISAVSGPEAQIAVVFVQPQHFTDVKYSKAEQHSVALLGELQKFMREMGEHYVPAGMQLEIKVTDIDLAGDFEPWRGPQFDHVRITRDIYPPRLSLEFYLTDGSGRVVSAGTREIRDIAYQGRLVRPFDDYLRYEKDMLRDWFHSEFSDIRTSPAHDGRNDLVLRESHDAGNPRTD